MGWAQLIEDLIFKLLIKLPIIDIFNICLTNKHWYSIYTTEKLWYKLLKRDYPYQSISTEHFKLCYRRKSILDYLSFSAGPNNTHGHIQASQISTMPESKWKIMEIIRNRIAPIGNFVRKIFIGIDPITGYTYEKGMVPGDNEEKDICMGFVLGPWDDIIFTRYGSTIDHLKLSNDLNTYQNNTTLFDYIPFKYQNRYMKNCPVDYDLYPRQTELFDYVKQYYYTYLSFKNKEHFLNIQREVIYRLNSEQLSWMNFIIE